MAHPETFSENRERLSKSLAVGIDIDDNVFDIRKPSLEIINKRYGTNFSIEDIKDFRYVQDFLKRLGHTNEEVDIFRDEIYRSVDDRYRVYRNSTVISGAAEVLNGLYRSGHQVYILTSRPPGLERITEEQFRAIGIDWVNGDWANGGNILIRDHEYWERTTSAEFKLMAIAGKFTFGKYKDFPGLNLHLDDMGELVYHPLSTEIKDRIFILAQKYNLEVVPPEKLVKNWWVFYKLVRCRARGEEFDLASVAQY
ncbi:MAG: hypothetical protein LiPW31_19 [Microgenomates group bacterium LiPW_31]|nr:MAG: hypothetical protein LiPW31_19 [Microgenomates group bacterium LiPW_31]